MCHTMVSHEISRLEFDAVQLDALEEPASGQSPEWRSSLHVGCCVELLTCTGVGGHRWMEAQVVSPRPQNVTVKYSSPVWGVGEVFVILPRLSKRLRSLSKPEACHKTRKLQGHVSMDWASLQKLNGGQDFSYPCGEWWHADPVIECVRGIALVACQTRLRGIAARHQGRLALEGSIKALSNQESKRPAAQLERFEANVANAATIQKPLEISAAGLPSVHSSRWRTRSYRKSPTTITASKNPRRQSNGSVKKPIRRVKGRGASEAARKKTEQLLKEARSQAEEDLARFWAEKAARLKAENAARAKVAECVRIQILDDARPTIVEDAEAKNPARLETGDEEDKAQHVVAARSTLQEMDEASTVQAAEIKVEKEVARGRAEEEAKLKANERIALSNSKEIVPATKQFDAKLKSQGNASTTHTEEARKLSKAEATARLCVEEESIEQLDEVRVFRCGAKDTPMSRNETVSHVLELFEAEIHCFSLEAQRLIDENEALRNDLGTSTLEAASNERLGQYPKQRTPQVVCSSIAWEMPMAKTEKVRRLLENCNARLEMHQRESQALRKERDALNQFRAVRDVSRLGSVSAELATALVRRRLVTDAGKTAATSTS